MRKSAYVRYIEKRNNFVQLEFMDLVGGLSYLEFPIKVLDKKVVAGVEVA
jgi:hypothetical protein